MVINLTVENSVEAKEQVELMQARGFSKDDMYIFAHSKKLEHDIADVLHTDEVGLIEEGPFIGIKNLFSSRGDELRSRMQVAGLTPAEASIAEQQLDLGKLVLVINNESA